MDDIAHIRAVGAGTRVVALLGHPVSHSLSPVIHNAAFAAAGFDAVYVALDVPPQRVPAAVEGVRALGLLGANVTVPHKRAVWELVGDRTAEAEAVGAANTLYWDGDRLVADNTDAAGLEVVLRRDLGLRGGEAVLVFGAGGAARAAAVALGRVGARVMVHARRAEAAEEVAALAASFGAQVVTGVEPDVVVNATPLGLRGERLPDPLMGLGEGQTALDLLYGLPTPFLDAARAAGARAEDGLGMLVAQAARSFTRWTGLEPPEEAMREAVATRAST